MDDELICLICGNYLSEEEWTDTLRMAQKNDAMEVPLAHPECWVLDLNAY